MRVQKHPNYFENILLSGGKVLSKFIMSPVKDKGGYGRIWEVSAGLSLNGYIFMLKGKFHGGLAETEENGKANLIIETVIKISTGEVFRRNSYGILMLICGVYLPYDKTSETEAAMRELCGYDTAMYCGIPTAEEFVALQELGYYNIVMWR